MNLVTISQAAKILELSNDTVRRWDKMGLIRSHRDLNNYRTFDLNELERVQAKYNGKVTNSFKIWKSKAKSDYKLVDLFSGAGGTSLGLENAGLKHVMLVEYDKDSVNTLRTNRPNWKVVHSDIADTNFKGIKADVVEGGFPCQAFSYAGKKMVFEDTRGTLFFDFARAVSEIQPKIAIAENVKGLLRHDDGKTLATMVNTLEELGYRVTYKVLRAQYFDVPQKRERLIILAIRKDLDIDFEFPKEKDYIISLKESLHGVPQSEGQKYPQKKYEIMKMIPPGGYWRDLPENVQREYMGNSYFQTGGKTGMARRLSWDEPS